MPILIIIVLAVVLLAAGAMLSSYFARKRREELTALALRLGLQFSKDDPYQIASRFRQLKPLCEGEERYAFNVIHGDYRGRRAICFDYHYETYSRDSKGHRRTHHHYFSAALLPVDVRFPRLLIRPENFFDKLAGVVGADDIDFESAEFSRRFFVKSDNRKFAYDIVHARTMEFLLTRGLSGAGLELAGDAVLLYGGDRWKAEELLRALEFVMDFVELVPAYVWDDLHVGREQKT